MVYCQIPEQIWMYILRNTAPAKAFLGIDRLYAHKVHKSSDSLHIDSVAEIPEVVRETTFPRRRMLQCIAVYYFHD